MKAGKRECLSVMVELFEWDLVMVTSLGKAGKIACSSHKST